MNTKQMKVFFRIHSGVVRLLVFIYYSGMLFNPTRIESGMKFCAVLLIGIAATSLIVYAITGRWPWNNEEEK